jgi:hypothetical protein
MQSKDQPLQIYKWNSYSMLLKFLGTIIIADHSSTINIGFVLMTWAIILVGQWNFFIIVRRAIPTVWPI